jgi:uncharacterized protein YggE
MKTKTVLISLFAVLLLASCGTNSTLSTTSPALSVTGSGQAAAKPDVVDIQLGVETANADATTAVDQNTSKINAVLDVLHNLGIDDADIQTVNYSMWVETLNDPNGQPTGEQRFHVSNQVSVRLRDLTQTGALLQQAIDAGATNVAGITFGVADPAELARTALDQALADAQQKADHITGEMGVTLGKVQTVIENGAATPPVPNMVKSTALSASTVPVSEGQFSVSAQVQVIYDIAP